LCREGLMSGRLSVLIICLVLAVDTIEDSVGDPVLGTRFGLLPRWIQLMTRLVPVL